MMSNKHLSEESSYLYANHVFGYENWSYEIKNQNSIFDIFVKILIGYHLHRFNESVMCKLFFTVNYVLRSERVTASLPLKLTAIYIVVSVRINLPLFSTVLPSKSCCFCPVGLSLL